MVTADRTRDAATVAMRDDVIGDAAEPQWGNCSFSQAKTALTSDERRFVTVASVAVVLLILTQKLSIGAGIQFSVVVVWPFSIWAFVKGYSSISPSRTIGFLFTMAAMVGVSIANSSNLGFSLTSPLFLIALYLPFIFVADVRRVVYLSVLGYFQIAGLFIASMVFLQWAQQAAGMSMLDMQKYVPSAFLFPGYNYLQTISYSSAWYKPNAFFMLETSHTSQLLAMSIVIEVVLFRRLWAMPWLLLALVMTFGGTGMIMVIATLPFLLPHLSRRIVVAGAIATPIVLLAAIKLGVLANALGRSHEFGQAGTSGQGRFLAPYQILGDTIAHIPGAALFGIGAGAKSPYQYSIYDVINPIAKSMLDYGVPAGVAWLIWFHACNFSSRVPFAILWVVLLPFDFMGGSMLVPVQVYYCLILCVMIRPTGDDREQGAIMRRGLLSASGRSTIQP